MFINVGRKGKKIDAQEKEKEDETAGRDTTAPQQKPCCERGLAGRWLPPLILNPLGDASLQARRRGQGREAKRLHQSCGLFLITATVGTSIQMLAKLTDLEFRRSPVQLLMD